MHILQSLAFIPKRIFGSVFRILVVCAFAIGLLFLFILYHPPLPGRYQRLGWQSWDVVTVDRDGNAVPVFDYPTTGGQKGSSSNSTDWWEEALAETGDSAASSLPLDVWDPLLPHHTGLTEIAVRPCLFSPAYGDVCAPRTTPHEDGLKGKWVRVDRDLNRKTGMWYLSLYYRRTRRLDVPLITDIMLLEESEFNKLPHPLSEWNKATGQLRDGVYPTQKDLFLWYKVRHPLGGINVTDSEKVKDLVTELDIQYGETPYTLWGFSKPNRAIVEMPKGKTTWLTYRKGFVPPPKAAPLHFNREGKFKILQIADLHFSVSEGDCKDVDVGLLPSSLGFDASTTECHGDTLTQTLIKQALAAENPDLVVFTGDQMNGMGTSWDAYSTLVKAIGEVVDAKVPWTVVFGNHDDEADMNRTEQMAMLKSLPYAVQGMEEGPGFVDGVGNYVLKVRSADASRTQLLTLYFLDSHAYTGSGWSFWKPAELDWIKPSQLEWFLEQSNTVDAIARPFTPDGGKDLGKVWKRTRTPRNRRLDVGVPRQSEEKKILAKPNALMFFHIPLPEIYDQPDVSTTGKLLQTSAELQEGCAPKHNSEFFANGVLKAKESEQSGSSIPEVKVIANGFCHISDKCQRVKGVWLCLGGGSSYSGYGDIEFDRRFRVYDVSDYGETIETYTRTAHGKIVDKTVLVGRNAMDTT